MIPKDQKNIRGEVHGNYKFGVYKFPVNIVIFVILDLKQ
jgi:hypothetical protein